MSKNIQDLMVMDIKLEGGGGGESVGKLWRSDFGDL